MPKDIKTKANVEKKIKSFDRTKIYIAKTKDRLLEAKMLSKKASNSLDELEENEQGVIFAEDKVIGTTKNIATLVTYETINDTKAMTKSYIKNRKNAKNLYAKEKMKKKIQNEKISKENKESNIKEDTSIQGRIKTKENYNKLKNNESVTNTSSKTNYKTIQEKGKLKVKSEKVKTNIKEKVEKAEKAIKETAKKVYQGIKGMIAFLVAGGGFALFLVIIVLLIAGFLGSAIGMFFTNETNTSETSISINSAITNLNDGLNQEIKEIKDNTNYDSVRTEKDEIDYKKIMALYSVVMTNRENNFNITEMNEENYERLQEIYDSVVDIDYHTEKYTVKVTKTDEDGNKTTHTESRTRLIINVDCLDIDEMIEKFDMNSKEEIQFREMIDEKYDEMWEKIIL